MLQRGEASLFGTICYFMFKIKFVAGPPLCMLCSWFELRVRSPSILDVSFEPLCKPIGAAYGLRMGSTALFYEVQR
jgi:hypothetical protein